jgi:hypothetical protein
MSKKKKMSLISELIQNLRNIVSGFVKPKGVTLPFEGLNLPSERMEARDLKKESPISKEEALNKANDFIHKAQQMLNSKDRDGHNGNINQ